ncbi:MAG TPA: M48 family metallopeptidase [Candidatus Omnitrophota bacterium]|nr:M48 family metallopeptidase [Candidatus Omnitrophota bacterium]
MTDSSRAKEYQRIKKMLSLVHLLLTPALLALWVLTPLASETRQMTVSFTDNPWIQVAVFFAVFSLFFFIIDFPLSFYSGFILEHRFQLSNLSLWGWIWEMKKRAVLSFLFSLALIQGLYFLIRFQPGSWWLWAWAAYAGVSWIMGKLFPVFVVPLFYKYQTLPEGELRSRILSLLSRFGLPAANIFSLNLSKTTKKANAAFMGLGKTKRVVLSDTLLEQFTLAEVEQVVAHELGHFKHGDIWKQLGLGLAISLLCFYLGYLGMESFALGLGLQSAADPASLPLLMLIFLGIAYISMPLTNGFSRVCEYAADRFALEACRDRDVFVSMMGKLGALNLADPDPPAWYEFLFYDHPSIKKRILAAQKWNSK